MATLMDTGDSETLTFTVLSDDQDGCVSPHSSGYNSSDLMAAAMGDEITAQLVVAGPVGMAAAAAIVSAKKRKRPYSFEMHPSRRKREQNRLLRKLSQTIDEFTTRVGQQAVVLVATPGEPTSFKCFGAQPLEGVVKNLRTTITDELETALAQQAPSPVREDPFLHELPPLRINGIPTPVERMTQEQLRGFIPLMLKYSTGRGKPGWGRESTKPPWWPQDTPWKNIRIDARSEIEKQKISWTHALRQIVINCYKFHGREDMLPALPEEEEEKPSGALKFHTNKKKSQQNPTHSPLQTQQVQTQYVLQTISNPDGTVSIIQVDPNNPIITLPDGMTAHVQGVATLHNEQGESVQVDLNNVTEESLNQDGQIVLTGEDGHGYPVSVAGMITVPVSASMYQTLVSNIQNIHTDGTIQMVTPMVHMPKTAPGTNNQNDVETLAGETHQIVTMSTDGSEPQVLQFLSLKDAAALTKALSQPTEIKTEETTTSDN